MTIQSARGPPGRAEEPGASLKTGLVEWRLARARASTPFGERSLCYQSRFADANSAARENAIVIRSTQPAFWPFALSRFVVQYGAWDIAHTGYRIHVFSRGKKGGKRDVHTSRFRLSKTSALRSRRSAVPADRGDRCVYVAHSQLPTPRVHEV